MGIITSITKNQTKKILFIEIKKSNSINVKKLLTDSNMSVNSSGSA